MTECRRCEEPIRDQAYCGDEGTEYGGDPLCEMCYYEAEPCATVVFGEDSEECPSYITPTRNDTEGQFTCHWVSTDPWRGHYRLQSDGWVRVHDDCILAYSRDEQNLKRFDELMRELLSQHDIPYARGFPRTSNVFSCGYELWIPEEEQTRYEELIMRAKKAAESELRDPWAFNVTALTGKDPEDCDSTDRLFALVGSMLLAGGR